MKPVTEKIANAFVELSQITEKITINLELTPFEIMKLAGTMQMVVDSVRRTAAEKNNDANLNHTADVVYNTRDNIIEQAFKACPRLLELCEEIGVGSVSA